MSQVEQILSEAMKLSGPERAELAERLLETIADEDAAIDPKIDAAWRAEAQRRAAELRSGAVAPIPWEDVDRQLSKERDREANPGSAGGLAEPKACAGGPMRVVVSRRAGRKTPAVTSDEAANAALCCGGA